MIREQLSLLLYLETCAVDGRGVVNQVHMNDDDRAQALRWAESGYIVYQHRPEEEIREMTRTSQKTHVVILSDAAWKDAHAERRARAERNKPAVKEATP